MEALISCRNVAGFSIVAIGFLDEHYVCLLLGCIEG